MTMEGSERKIIADNLKSLMKQADLTIDGAAEGTKLTTHTIVKILNEKTDAAPKTLKKITEFFNITREQLYSSTPIKIKVEKHLKKFKESNKTNNKYFVSRAKENVVAHFLKNVLIKDPFLNEGRRVRETTTYIRNNPKYKKSFNNKAIAKELERMHRAGLLKKEDKTGKRSVYYYSLAKPITVQG